MKMRGREMACRCREGSRRVAESGVVEAGVGEGEGEGDEAWWHKKAWFVWR